ncbi:HAD hydrolase-like protein [Breoghania sp.]|uniref:HAD hydrolase-like protein n=1 Tax=Breoghania sp. TaxID=2065378 RepID=UPI0026373874|nr:HAD hydrolase-like protein [Breoghania sp.]MDJ0929918.1 HAD hydrolase-like protein [Breoghania sp.]
MISTLSGDSCGRAVLFDLDGTLTDPFPGITRSFQYALECMGVEDVPDADDLRYIGPPLSNSFAVLLGKDDPQRIQEAIGHYRVRYGETGLFENQVIDGVREVLSALQDRGHALLCGDLETARTAVRIVEHFDLADYFSGIYVLRHLRRPSRWQSGFKVQVDRVSPARRKGRCVAKHHDR